MDDAHRPLVKPDGKPYPPSWFDGRLGKIANLRPVAEGDFSGFAGDWLCPAPINALSPDKPVRMSATFDPNTKKLTKVSLVHHPRIPDAAALPAGTVEFSEDAVFAALADEEARKAAARPDVAPAAAVPSPAPATFAATTHTPHGLSSLQAIHDMAARSGALCHERKPTMETISVPVGRVKIPPAFAEFTTEPERDAHQTVHDACCAGGAKCRVMADDDPRVKSLAGTRDAYFSHAEFADAMTPTERLLHRQLETERAERAAEREDARRVQFAAGLESARHKAASAARKLWDEGKIVAAEIAGCEGEYLRAVEDDLRHPGEVQFSLDGESYRKGSREAAVLARWEKKLPLRILGEVADNRADPAEARFALQEAIPESADNPTKPRPAAVAAALKGAGPAGEAALAARNGAAK